AGCRRLRAPAGGGPVCLPRAAARAGWCRAAGWSQGSSFVLLRVVGGERDDDRGVIGVAGPVAGASAGGVALAGLSRQVGADGQGFVVEFDHRHQVRGLFLLEDEEERDVLFSKAEGALPVDVPGGL